MILLLLKSFILLLLIAIFYFHSTHQKDPTPGLQNSVSFFDIKSDANYCIATVSSRFHPIAFSWSNIDLPGQFMYRIDSNDIQGPDLITDDVKSDSPENCAEATTYCHVQATCIDYEEGFCCECKKQYYGNGRFCVKKGVLSQ